MTGFFGHRNAIKLAFKRKQCYLGILLHRDKKSFNKEHIKEHLELMLNII